VLHVETGVLMARAVVGTSPSRRMQLFFRQTANKIFRQNPHLEELELLRLNVVAVRRVRRAARLESIKAFSFLVNKPVKFPAHLEELELFFLKVVAVCSEGAPLGGRRAADQQPDARPLCRQPAELRHGAANG